MPAKKKIKDRYEIQEILGKGGMGLVYKAYDTVVQREVALKTLRDTPSKMALDLFRKECGVLASMSHPNIVEIFDIGEIVEDGATKPYFVMPLLPGVTLEQLIRISSQRLTVERSIEIILQTCRGLHAAHERGLVHRDLKPSNIFVMPDDAVKIIDFGVAHMADTTATMTVAGGTLPYMAPEQIEMKPASPLSDIFSLGVVFYETLTRRRPFDFATEQETAHAILHNIPPAASELNPAVSHAVSRVIHKAMAKQAWNRFATAREFADTLIKAQRNEPIEMFDSARIQPRIQKAAKAYEQGNYQFATEILNELESEGHVETSMTLLRRQLDQAVRQKTIGQLLESARTCMQEEEYLLALQKIQEILQLDPDNTSAITLKSTIETRRSEAKVEEWVKLARQHLENNAFSHARDALQNLLQLRPKDTTALQLLVEVDRREEQYLKARKDKEDLYKLALEAWQNGEMSSALTKLERLVDLDRRVPDTSAPDRGISYQNFYNQVRSEHDLLRSSYQEARKHLVDGNYSTALSICSQYLGKYPGHALFQALKFDVEERQRQDLSSHVAEIDRQVDAEPDLERRVNILKEALDTYPGEPHFEKALRLMRDKRDLVNSIVAKARAYEDRGQFTEALGQWEILQTIHQQFPGLDFEIDRVMKRRDQQSRADAKARWVEQIDRHLEAGDYERAIELLRNAETEFPGDPEMAALGELARHSQARAAEADQIFKQGQEMSAQRQFGEAIELLRRAQEMDPHNSVIRAFLLETLLDNARAVLDSDWRAAETLCQQALDLDPNHSLAKGLRGMALDRKREEEVSQSVAEARRLQAAGNVPGALAVIEQGLAAHPRETRLTQLHATLCKSIPDAATRAEAAARATAVTQSAVYPPTVTQPPAAQPPATAPADAHAETVPRPAPAAGEPAPARWEEFEQRLHEQPAGPQAESPTVVMPQPAAEPLTMAACAAEGIGVESRPPQVSPLETPQPAPAAGAVGAAPPPAVAPPVMPTARPQQPPGSKPPVSRTVVWLSSAAAVLLLIVALIAGALRPVEVEIRTNPPGATIRINNEIRGAGNLSLKLRAGAYQVSAEKEGYISSSQPLVVKRGSPASIAFNLVPVPPPTPLVELPPVLRLSSDLAQGKVTVDGEPPADLQEGQFTTESLHWGKHTLEITSGSARAAVTFDVQPSRAPALSEPPSGKELKTVVVTSFGNQAHIQASYSPVKVTVDNQDLGEIGASGLDLPNLSVGTHEVILAESKEHHTISLTNGPAPLLEIELFSDRDVGSLLVLTGGQDGVHLEIDGKPSKKTSKGGQIRLTNLTVKNHAVRVFKDGFQEEPAENVAIKKGEEAKLEFHLRPVPTVGALALHGAAAGLQVTLDQKPVGTVGADGSFTFSNIAPGSHTIELSDGHHHKQIARAFKAGETLQIGPPDVVLQAATVAVKISVSPANAVVSYKTPDNKTHEVHNGSLELEEGQYVFTASAPGHTDATETVTVAAGKPVTVVLNLLTKSGVPHVGPVKMEDWAMAAGWKTEDNWLVHRGGGIVLYPAVPSSGTFVFTAMRQAGILGKGRIQWVVGSTEDKRSYVLFGIDKKNIHRAEYAAGKKEKDSDKTESLKAAAAPKELQYSIKVDISSESVVTSVQQGGNWVVVDTWPASGLNPANGKFGFYLPGNDELYISNFSFTPK